MPCRINTVPVQKNLNTEQDPLWQVSKLRYMFNRLNQIL
jgi:hypothetical protein